MVNLDKLTGRILSDAEEFARGLLESAQAEIAEVNREAQIKIDSIKSEYAARAEKEEKAIIERAEAVAKSLSRDVVLDAKTALLDKVFEQAKERLVGLAESGTDVYVDFLASLLCKVISSAAASEKTNAEYYRQGELLAENEYTVLFCARDLAGESSSVAEKATAEAASRIADTGKSVAVSSSPVNIDGGFILRCGNIEYNCSLSALVAGCRASLESEIYRNLFEQTE